MSFSSENDSRSKEVQPQPFYENIPKILKPYDLSALYQVTNIWKQSWELNQSLLGSLHTLGKESPKLKDA